MKAECVAAGKDWNIEKLRHLGATEVLYCIVLYCTVLYCIILYCTVLYCIELYTEY